MHYRLRVMQTSFARVCALCSTAILFCACGDANEGSQSMGGIFNLNRNQAEFLLGVAF